MLGAQVVRRAERERQTWPTRREELLLRHLFVVGRVLSDRPELGGALPFAEAMWESVRWTA